MRQNFFIAILLTVFIIPLSVSAFWGWGKKTQSAPPPVAKELSAAEKEAADYKYKLWQDSFDQRDVGAVMVNQDKFFFTVPELNYLFNSEAAKAKKPFVTDFNLSADGETLKVAANFRKKLTGRVTFTTKAVIKENKIRFNISKAKFRGWPVPASWINGLLNRELDDYFSFLYADKRYQTISFTNANGVLKLKPEFK